MSNTASISAAIILAAGEGTRMRSSKPKVLHELAGKTFLNRVMDAVSQLQPDVLSLVVRHQAQRVAEAACSYNSTVRVVEQDDTPGTGRAVQCAINQLGDEIKDHGTVLIVASDMPLLDSDTLQGLVDFHKAQADSATVLTAHLENPEGYGRIVRSQDGQVLRIVEHKDATSSELEIHEVNTSVYVFDAAVLKTATAGLNNQNSQGEFYLTDALEAARAIGRVGAYTATDPLCVEGVNSRSQLAHLSKAYNARICEQWMNEGVTILDPDSTWIDEDVKISPDVVILPGCFLRGHTEIGTEAVIGPYTTLTNARVGSNACVERSTVNDCVIGDEANIGPWTYLRPGNVLGEASKAGAFVEMKNAQVDKGSKVPHLSYMGDVHIGENSNIGGGSITANYDGVHKNHTEIGSGVHVGAGNLFVAPVTVGNSVTTGAGSVIRHQVPDDAMAYSENTQHVVEDWQPSWKRHSKDNKD